MDTDKERNQLRSQIMSRIKGKHTAPERFIRSVLHQKGFRYRLHDKRLPGKPDLSFPKYRAVIEVRGCFWHGHGCHMFKWPKTRQDFWQNKILRNRERDLENLAKLEQRGWKPLVIWECALRGKEALPQQELASTIEAWLINDPCSAEIRGRPKSRTMLLHSK